MRCPYCRGEISSYTLFCPYCGKSVNQSTNEMEAIDKKLEKRFLQIDEVFGLKKDYVSMDTNTLNKFFNDIFEKFQNIDLNDLEVKANLEKIMNHLCQVDEHLQSRFPERGEEAPKSNFKGSGSIVLDLLENCNPPEVNCAAYKIRSATERMLKDYYKFPYGVVNVTPEGRKTYGFKTKYPEMFKNVTKSPEIAKEMFNDHLLINKFVHEGKENDQAILERFPTKELQARFLKKAYELRKKYNLV